MENIQPTDDAIQPLAIENWIPSSELEVDLDNPPTSIAFDSLNDIIEKTNDMLKEECTHILRQAQSAISRANVTHVS